MSVRCRRADLALIVAASIVFGLLAVAVHSHASTSTSTGCTLCTLVHVSAAPAVGCLGTHVPWVERRLGPPDAVALLDEPVLCSHASRAPPAHPCLEI